MNKTDKITREFLLKARQKRGLKVAGPEAASKRHFSAWQRAAAVLDRFDLDTLRPFGSPEKDAAAAKKELLAVSRRVPAHNGAAWRIEDYRRRAVLRSFNDRTEMAAALNANRSDNPSDVQKLIDAAVKGELNPVDSLSQKELGGLLQVISWFEGVIEPLPTKRDIQAAYERLSLLDPFDHLAGPDRYFFGREKELKRLGDFISLEGEDEPAQTNQPHPAAAVPRPPLMIHAPGGMGKSTLIAKFILEHVGLPGKKRFPWIYLDFDRPVVMPRVPFTILIEGIKQIGLQYPKGRESANLLAKRWQKEVLNKWTTDQVSSYESENWIRACRAFGNLLHTLELADRPLVIILDTFEEVQSRGSRTVEKLLKFLVVLQKYVPQVRIIFSGRAPLDKYSNIIETESLPLKEFSQAEAQQYLRNRRLTREGLISRLAKISRGSPLALWLIARLCDEHEDIAQLDLRHIKIEQIQMLLFNRILGHIHSQDERVHELAHPGLVLRRITPEIILYVLADHCGVTLNGSTVEEKLLDAEHLYEELKVEVALVREEFDADGKPALYHRQDLRRLMLGLLRDSADKEKLQQIEREAVDFYSRRPSPAHLAEEIYHRLRLKEPVSLLDERWDSGPIDTRTLPNAREEISAEMWQWLATKLDVELTDDEIRLAGQTIWENQIAIKLRDLVNRGYLQKALDLLEERTERLSCSALFALEADLRQRLGQTENAFETLAAGLQSARDAANVNLTIKLMLQKARFERDEGNYAAAVQSLDQVRDNLKALNRPPALVNLHYQIDRLILSRLIGEENDDQHLKNFEQAFAELTDTDIRHNVELMGEIVTLIDVRLPKILWRIIDVTGVEKEPQTLVRQLAAEIAMWDKAISMSKKRSAGVVAKKFGVPQAGSLTQSWAQFLLTTPALGEVLLALVEQYRPAPDGFLAATVNLLANRYRDSQGSSEIVPRHELITSADTQVLALSPAQLGELRRSIAAEFSRQELSDIVYYRIGQSLESISVDQNSEKFVVSLLDYINRHALMKQLLNALQNARPRNPVFPALLASFFSRSGEPKVGSSGENVEDLFVELLQAGEEDFDPSGQTEELWKQMHSWIRDRSLSEVNSLLQRLAEIDFLEISAEEWVNIYLALTNQIAVIQMGDHKQTGILVGPDLLLTIPPAGEELPKREAISLQFADSVRIQKLIRSDWLVTRPNAYYLLLRLSEKVGELPIGGSYEFEAGARHRGWVELPATPDPLDEQRNRLVLLLQDTGRSSRRIRGITGRITDFRADGSFVVETPLNDGVVGVPVFDKNLELIGLINGRVPQQPERFTGLSLATIVARLGEANEIYHLAEGQSGDNAIGGVVGDKNITIQIGGDNIGIVHTGGGNFETRVPLLKEAQPETGTHADEETGQDHRLEIIKELNQDAERRLKKGFSERAIVFYDKALAVAREVGHPELVVNQMVRLAGALLTAGQINEAQALYERCEDMVEIDSPQAVFVYDGLGLIQRLNGELEKSKGYYRQGLAIATQLGDLEYQGITSANLGLVFQHNEDYEQAADAYQRAVQIFRENGDLNGIANTVLNLGEIFILWERYDEAANLLFQGLEAVKSIGDQHLKGKYDHSLGLVFAGQNQIDRAMAHLEQGLAIMRQVGDRHSEAHILRDLGGVLVQANLLEKAITPLRSALKIARELNDLRSIAAAAEALGRLYEKLRETDSARTFLEVALAAYQRLEFPAADKVKETLERLQK